MKDDRSLEMIDTAVWNDTQRFDAYGDVIKVSVIKRSAIRRVYGSNRNPAMNFGEGVPSLVIYDEDGHPVDAYPREENGSIITIWDYLTENTEISD
ncbi:MAG: hypothetical protein GF309_13470 [Candidatus Lokiarchaeota archaeon]|nr:hypothetical protein [Candidatus Lokiarchaeota archaeon]